MVAIQSWQSPFVLQFILLLIGNGVVCWSLDPLSYYQRNNDGSYKYGYDAGGGFSARQSANAANEVEGQYSQLHPDGNLVNVRYKAGVGGFRPQLGLGTARPYRFAYNTGDASHYAAADHRGNVRGKYWYRDHAGEHDLHYTAGPGIGFVPTGGSLAVPNGLIGRRSLTGGPRWVGPGGNVYGAGPRVGGPYGNGYANGDAAGPEVVDADGNVRGGYPYRNGVSNQDLPYANGDATRSGVNGDADAQGGYHNNHNLPSVDGNAHGFQPAGRSSANPNGLHSRSPIVTLSSTPRSVLVAPDGSYNFGYQTPDSARQESGDARGNVHGSYSFRNEGGNHDLSFVAGPGTGFRPTGGSLANGIGGRGATAGGFNPTTRALADDAGIDASRGTHHPSYATGYPTGSSGINGHRSLGASSSDGLGSTHGINGHNGASGIGGRVAATGTRVIGDDTGIGASRGTHQGHPSYAAGYPTGSSEINGQRSLGAGIGGAGLGSTHGIHGHNGGLGGETVQGNRRVNGGSNLGSSLYGDGLNGGDLIGGHGGSSNIGGSAGDSDARLGTGPTRIGLNGGTGHTTGYAGGLQSHGNTGTNLGYGLSDSHRSGVNHHGIQGGAGGFGAGGDSGGLSVQPLHTTSSNHALGSSSGGSNGGSSNLGHGSGNQAQHGSTSFNGAVGEKYSYKNNGELQDLQTTVGQETSSIQERSDTKSSNS